VTQVIEGVSLPTVDKGSCPICEKSPHPDRTTKDKKEKKGCLGSIPKNLGCAPLPLIPGIPNYATAAHHLIPANQCLKAFPRLSQMCETVGYDVNNSANGIPLPTCGQGALNNYSTNAGSATNYGNLNNADKTNAAFVIMENLQLQWHVGHHDWAMDWETDSAVHPENYDKLVKTKLRALESKIQKKGKEICDPPDESESGQKVISELNSLSTTIKAAVVGWKAYYVSAMSCRFAQKYK